ncbi:hypothetical protein [Tissierella praeacuta]|uniref:hypothetical protein n=1 Tax=Tissierella praeacuta TaxID=43131 RepID=UPI002FDAE6A1
MCSYARVSTDSIEQQDSFYYQVEYYKSYIGKRDDWEYAGIYSDEGKIDLIITKKVMNNTRMKEVKIIHKICKKSD